MKIYLFDISKINMQYVKDNLSCLSSARVEKVNKMKREKDKMLSFAAGMALDRALKDFGYAEKNMEYRYSEKGKPYLVFDKESLYFNLSHSGNMAVAVVAKNEVGIDLELIRDYREAVVKRCFSLMEKEYIDKSSDKLKSFYGIWTMKEAYVKLTGRGITFDMSLMDTSNIFLNEKTNEGVIVEQEKDNANETQSIGASGKVIYDIEGYVMSVSTYERVENIEWIWIKPI